MSEHEDEGAGPVGHPVTSVWFNDGTDEDIFALVAADLGATKLNLIACPPGGSPYPVNDVPQREKADYGDQGGGLTWHLVK